jgi:hypothetical protein
MTCDRAIVLSALLQFKASDYNFGTKYFFNLNLGPAHYCRSHGQLDRSVDV